jgi:hypothetical protein
MIHLTPKQAFRAGYREGIKMALHDGSPFTCSSTQIHNQISENNLFRLKVWCEFGRHQTNGIWSIYGARLGLLDVLTKSHIYKNIRDYEWFENFWIHDIKKNNPEIEALKAAKVLERTFHFQINEYNEQQSMRLVNRVPSPIRQGLMI